MRSGAAALVAVALAMAMAPRPAWGTPTGLNNIPTADAVSQNVLVLQSWTDFGPDRDASWAAGLKYGAAENWEVGLDDAVAGPGSAGGPTAQAKYRIALSSGARAALGLANVSNDRDRHGSVFPYAVLSAPLGATANGHLGYAFQSGNHALFLGADAAASKSLTLRTDWTQTEDGDESVWSLGFITSVTDDFLVEAWASFPTAVGANTDYVVKADYVIRFGG
jgi:hypothetical protein